MAAASLLDECQTLFEKGHYSWQSYFSKWEVFAKYEEDVPESELFTETKKKAKSSKQKKVKRQLNRRKPTVLLSTKYKRRQRQIKNRKKAFPESKQDININEPFDDQNSENLVEDTDNKQLETILKTVFREVLKVNKNEFQMFTVLSQTFSGGELRNSKMFQHALADPKFLEPMVECETNMQMISPYRSTYIGNLTKNSNLYKFSTNFKDSEHIRNSIFKDNFPRFKINYQNNLNAPQLFLPVSGNQTLRETKLGVKNSKPALLNSSSTGNTNLMSFEWDLSLKSQNSICGKINKEHFIKRTFHKMNMMEEDGKRFRDLCLRKRTNSVTLSMENSNFITPERNPPERKCFSENISQRKRRLPSKLFFGNEEEDSESDDQTEKQRPILHCKSKKPKIQIISEVVESDSDDCGSIFDRVSRS